MITGGLDGGYRGMLATSYYVYFRLEVWRAGVRVDTFGTLGLPKLSGTLTATLQNRVARQLGFVLPNDFAPEDINDPDYLLSPLNKEIRAFAAYENGAYEFPIFRGRVQTVDYDADSSQVAISCSDLGQDILDDQFSAPRNSNTNLLAIDQYIALISETLPTSNFEKLGSFFSLMPSVTWDSDRGQACDDCATQNNAYWYALADGSFTMQTVPWTVDTPPLVTLINGQGGVLVSYSINADRTQVYNRVVVAGERADGTTPVHAVAQDGDIASPTYIGGDFGRRCRTVQIQTATSPGQAQGLATQQVLISRAFKQTWSVSMPPDASLELGDVVTCQDRTGRSSIQVISGFTMSLTKGTMNISFRAQSSGVVIG